jgi:hypothetical protein
MTRTAPCPSARLILNVHVEAIDQAAALEAAKPVLHRIQGFARIVPRARLSEIRCTVQRLARHGR